MMAYLKWCKKNYQDYPIPWPPENAPSTPLSTMLTREKALFFTNFCLMPGTIHKVLLFYMFSRDKDKISGYQKKKKNLIIISL